MGKPYVFINVEYDITELTGILEQHHDYVKMLLKELFDPYMIQIARMDTLQNGQIFFLEVPEIEEYHFPIVYVYFIINEVVGKTAMLTVVISTPQELPGTLLTLGLKLLPDRMQVIHL